MKNEKMFAANDIIKRELIFYDNNFKEISKIQNIQTGIEPAIKNGNDK